ncbi:MAG: hypothetical protein M5U19_22580 [Microthrixaceae bacterium]|nr:hypothetical protein [Microthrixaceae bacterium]
MTETPDSLPLRNTYDKYGSTNPVERRLMDGFFEALDNACPHSTRPRCSRWVQERAR